MSDTEMSTADLLDTLAALDSPRRREVADQLRQASPTFAEVSDGQEGFIRSRCPGGTGRVDGGGGQDGERLSPAAIAHDIVAHRMEAGVAGGLLSSGRQARATHVCAPTGNAASRG